MQWCFCLVVLPPFTFLFFFFYSNSVSFDTHWNWLSRIPCSMPLLVPSSFDNLLHIRVLSLLSSIVSIFPRWPRKGLLPEHMVDCVLLLSHHSASSVSACLPGWSDAKTHLYFTTNLSEEPCYKLTLKQIVHIPNGRKEEAVEGTKRRSSLTFFSTANLLPIWALVKTGLSGWPFVWRLTFLRRGTLQNTSNTTHQGPKWYKRFGNRLYHSLQWLHITALISWGNFTRGKSPDRDTRSRSFYGWAPMGQAVL